MWKRRRLYASLMVVLLIAGCSANKNAGNGTEKPAAASPSASNEPVELTIYSAGGTDNDEFEHNYADPIRKKFPNVTIKYINPRDGNPDANKLDSLIAAGTNIDLYYESIGTFFSTLSRNQASFDLTETIKKTKLD